MSEMEIRNETFFNFKNYFWLKVNLTVVILCSLFYIFYDPIGPRDGSTLAGQILGVISLLLYFYVFFYALQKRNYKTNKNSLKGLLSAHVWIGLSLLVIVPLHSGFSFGLNVHSFSYYFLLLVVLTGIWGAINYTRLSAEAELSKNTIRELLLQINDLKSDIEIQSANKSDKFIALKRSLDSKAKLFFWSLFFSAPIPKLDTQSAASAVLDLEAEERDEALKVINKLGKKVDVQRIVQAKIKNDTWLKIWLYFHVPLAFACLILVLLHIFWVLKF